MENVIVIEAYTTDYSATQLDSVRVYADAETLARLPKIARLTYVNFLKNGANGGVNETGIKRVKSLLKSADKLGIGVTFAQPAHISDELNAPLWSFGMRAVTRSELEKLI